MIQAASFFVSSPVPKLKKAERLHRPSSEGIHSYGFFSIRKLRLPGIGFSLTV